MQDITNSALRGVSSGTPKTDEEQEARVFNSSVLDGKLSERGGVLGPKDLCTKTGAPVIEVLRSKHPDQRIPDLQDPENLAFSEYPEVPDPIPIDCDPVTVESVAKKLTGAVGCSGVDSALLKS